MSYIILRDIPKQSVQLDLLVYPISGGFRGFREVPAGFHYGAILSQEKWQTFWCYLPSETVVVKRFDFELQELVDDAPEQTAHYTQLASQRAMDQVLMAYPRQQYSDWQSLTQHITTNSPKLHVEMSQPLAEEVDLNYQSRFEQSFIITHQSNIKDWLAEFQFAFIRWLMASKEKPDQIAQKRWSSLLDGMYNAGEYAIAAYPDLFSQFMDVLLAQLAQLPAEAFFSNSIVCQNLNYLIEDISDTQIAELCKKSQILLGYVQQRQTTEQ